MAFPLGKMVRAGPDGQQPGGRLDRPGAAVNFVTGAMIIG